MKKSIRFTSILLALIMLISALPMSAFAADPTVITEIVYVTDVHEPAAGQPVFEPTLKSVNGSSSLKTLINPSTTIDWFCNDTYSLKVSDYLQYNSSTFTSGYAYELYFNVKPANNAVFSSDCQLVLQTPKGNIHARLVNNSNNSNYTFDILYGDMASNVITSIEYQTNVPYPSAGGALYYPSVSKVNGSADKVSLLGANDLDWFYSTEYSIDGDNYNSYDASTFVTGNVYDLYIQLWAKSDVYFSRNCTHTVKGGNSSKKGYMYFNENTKAAFDVFFEELWGKTVIKSVDLTTDIAKPVVNQSFYYPEVISLNGKTQLTSLLKNANRSWYYSPEYTTDGDDYYRSRAVTFDRGWAYDLYVSLECNDTAVFAEDCVFNLRTPNGIISGYLYDFNDSDPYEIHFDFFFDLTGGIPTRRLFGSSRFKTAVNIANDGWNTSNSIVLASGENYPDALAGSVLAAELNAPILLASKNSIDTDTMNKIEELEPAKIYILGGTAAISEAVENSLASKYTVERVYGDSRNATAAKIAAKLPVGDTIFLVSNANFADALSAGAAASLLGAPILYVNANGTLPQETVEAMEVRGTTKAYIIGGTAAINSAAESNLSAVGIDSKRIYGNDRQLTSIAVYNEFSSLFYDDYAALATGLNFPDALSGVALAAYYEMPLFLVVNSAPTQLLDTLDNMSLQELYVFGGTGAVPESVIDSISNRLYSDTTPAPEMRPILGGETKPERAESVAESVPSNPNKR